MRTEMGLPSKELFQPIVETREAKKTSTDSATLRGSLVDNGGARIIERGFLLSAKPNPKPGRKSVTRLGRQRLEELPSSGHLFETGQKVLLSGLCDQRPRHRPRFGGELHHHRRSTLSKLDQRPTGCRRQLVDEPLVRELLSQRQWLGTSRTARLGFPHGEPDGGPVALETRPRLALDEQGNLSVLI